MLHYALNIKEVTLPNAVAAWPTPLSVAVALNEVLLIEGADPATAKPLLEIAATLGSPMTGQVRHWGQIAETLPREELYRLRRRIAFISPQQVLLQHLTLGQNIALGPCYHQGYSESEALAPHADLIERLKLQAYLDLFPDQTSAAVYTRAVWARELLKGAELIIAFISANAATAGEAAMLVAALQEYLFSYGAAALLLGESLEHYYPLGHRLLRLESGQLLKMPVLEHRTRPLTTYLPLV